MCPCVLKGHLSVVSQDVSGGSIMDWHHDETLPIKTTTSVADTCKEDGQVVRLAIEFFFEGRDGLVVQFGRRRSSVGVVVIQDGMSPSRSQSERWRCWRCWSCRRGRRWWWLYRWSRGGGWLGLWSLLALVHVPLLWLCLLCTTSLLSSCCDDGSV